MMPWGLVLLAVLVPGVFCMIEEIPLPPDIQECLDQVHAKTNLTEVVGENVVWRCVHGSLWKKAKENPNSQLSEKALKWFATLINKSVHEGDLHGRRSRSRRQTARLRVRREYRMLSDTERNNFHLALNMLKADTSVEPNRYDALGRLHELNGNRSHEGPNFLGWHRLFLIMSENAMREKIPTLILPYWDSTMDAKLPDPRASIIFSPEFMGTGKGIVNTGPSRYWTTPWGPLIRNFGQDGVLMNWTSIRDVFTRRRLLEITMPNAEAKYNFEDIHGEPHLWVGGHMSPQALAGYDPIFFLHHCFIDLLWEIFRMLQRTRGVDPTKDYPNNTVPEGHEFNDPSGFEWLTNEHALSDYYTSNIYTYELPPSCTRERPNCGSPYLRCDTSMVKPSCVSLTIFDTQPSDFVLENNFSPHNDISRLRENPGRGGNGRLDQERTRDAQSLWNLFGGNRRGRRAAQSNETKSMALSKLTSIFETSYSVFSENQSFQCQPNDWNEQYVNNFNIDGVTDRRLWVYIPVGIIYRKDPERLGFNYHSYLQVYSKCKRGISINPHISIESNGLNYMGMYKEVIPINKDTPVLSTSAFIGVKVPYGNATDVLLVAYDVCGRVCQPYCLSRLHDYKYQPCSGSIRITSDYPKMYGESVTELVNDIFKEHTRGALPELDSKEIFIQFYCNNKEWPWES